MPFKAPFTNTYTKGDLFYGFSAPRAALMAHLNVPTSDRGLSALWTINNYMITGEEQDSIKTKLESDLDNFAFEKGKEIKAQDPEWEKIKHLGWSSPEKKKYAEKLQLTIDDLKKVQELALLKPHQNFEKTLKEYKGGKYKDAIGFRVDSSGDKDAENVKQNAAWRKKCKGELYHGVFVLKVTVHFCLAQEENGGFVEMDHKQVASKTDPYDREADSVKGKLRVITPAELRWVYRNKDSEEVQKHVQFWKYKDSSWITCGPPWSDGEDAVRNIWSQYKPKCNLVHNKDD